VTFDLWPSARVDKAIPPQYPKAGTMRAVEDRSQTIFHPQLVRPPAFNAPSPSEVILYKMCKTCEVLPASYILRQEFIGVNNVRCYGGFADISEGECLGRRVAIKHLRIGVKDASNRVFKVLEFLPTWYPIVT